MIASDIQVKVIKIFIILFLFMTLIARSEEIVVEIQNPKFYEKSLDDKAYEIKAKKVSKKEKI